MKWPRRTLALWIFCICGLIVSLLISLPRELEINLSDEAPPELQIHDPKFPVPEPRPREDGNYLRRHFIFELAGTDKISGKDREKRLLQRYDEIVAKLPGSEVPKVTVDTSQGVAVVVIDGSPFVTVLPQDCPDYYLRLNDSGKLALETEVAYGWARVIWERLEAKSLKSQADYLHFYNGWALVFFFVFSLLSLTLSWISHRFLKSPLWSLRALLWLVYASMLTAFHPSLDSVALLLYQGALVPLSQAFVVFIGTGFLHQLSILSLRRYFRALAVYEDKASQRAALRRQTLQQASFFISKLFWTFLGFSYYLYLRHVDLGAFFAGAGLIGVAVGVLARDVFVDFLNGVNILIEDQYGVGDWIELDNETNSGKVVAFSLRATKIRRMDGSLATLPNSDIRRVRNHSNEWAQVDYRVRVTYSTNTDRALASIMDEISLLQTEWQEKIIEPAEPLGIQELGPDGVELRVLIKTVPLAQWETRRRLNSRVKKRFEQDGIMFAAPRSSTTVRPDPYAKPFLIEVERLESRPEGKDVPAS